MSGQLRRIKTVEPRSGHRIAIAWDAGPRMIVDLSAMIAKGGVFSEIQDEAVFSQVRVGGRRRVIEWPRPCDEFGRPVIEMDADSLFGMGTMQKADSTVHRLIDTVSKTLRKNPHPA